MSYDFESYRGTYGHGSDLSSSAAAPASPVTTDGFVEMVQLQCPGRFPDSEGFSAVLRGESYPIVVEFHPDEEDRLGTDRSLGLAVAHNVARHRRFLWQRGMPPGIYTVAKTIFVERAEDGSNLQAQVRENTRSLVTLGRGVDSFDTRPASQDEVVAAIDTIFTVAHGITLEYTAPTSPDSPASGPAWPWLF